ncbi:hypothetical protein CPB84DRAFT_1961696 [Gymnopilus junonius]|uniref:MYND-type domain-containing protein n=1 Tax=Gymnopilus junonius TaxID=109634 RepID=A0A9P5TPR3_GYMJU|nr:hypothetical protein CPB84DRAFT_1961696 [Gymnopilus junonius]
MPPVAVTIEFPPCHRAKSSPAQWDADFESLFRRRTILTTAKGYFDACAYKERTANKVNACYGCGKTSEKRDGLKKCAACWKINREVLYCSRECQVANWKAEHKLMCGKPLDFDTAAMLSTIVPKIKSPSGFPPSVVKS